MTDEEVDRAQQERLERRLDATVKPAAGCLFDGCLIGLLPVVTALILPVALSFGR